MIYCTWTLCKHCKDIKNICGTCKHPNGSKKDDIKTKEDTMVSCKLYSS